MTIPIEGIKVTELSNLKIGDHFRIYVPTGTVEYDCTCGCRERWKILRVNDELDTVFCSSDKKGERTFHVSKLVICLDKARTGFGRFICRIEE